MRCDADSGLIVIVNAIEYQCVNEGDIVVISQSTSDWHHRGSIVCPSCDRYCKVTKITCFVMCYIFQNMFITLCHVK